MAGFTNKGKMKLLDWALRQTAPPTNLYVALVTSAVAPGPDTNTLGELTEVTAGNGYTAGGISLTPGSTDFDVVTEDDTGDKGYIQIKDVSWTASGGTLPSAGTARYVVLTDDNGTLASREVYYYWDLTLNRQVADGDVFLLQDLQIDLRES